MGISPWQSLCCVLLGAIVAVWLDHGSKNHHQPWIAVEQENKLSSSSSSSSCPPPMANIPDYPSPQGATPNNIIGANHYEQQQPTVQVDNDMLAATAYAKKWNQTVAASQGKPLQYLTDPQAFIQRVQDCSLDPHCHVMYHHVSKTGGTTLEQALFPVFGQDVMYTCCHQRLRQQIMEDPDAFCNLKFSSYQMFDDEFLEVVHTCQQRNPHRRTLLLTSFREPTRTLLSYIHQMCNKMLHKRTERVREACQTCVYENSTDVWHFMAYIIQRQIEGAHRVSRSCLIDNNNNNSNNNTNNNNSNDNNNSDDEYYIHHKDERTVTVVVHTPHEHSVQNFTLDKRRLQVLLLETNDVDSFLWHWQPDIVFGMANPQQDGDCYFRLTTELMKQLRPALAIYRKLLAGL